MIIITIIPTIIIISIIIINIVIIIITLTIIPFPYSYYFGYYYFNSIIIVVGIITVTLFILTNLLTESMALCMASRTSDMLPPASLSESSTSGRASSIGGGHGRSWQEITNLSQII